VGLPNNKIITREMLKHHWGEPDGKQLEKQVNVAVLLKTKPCAEILCRN